jgi:hypothetical protein
MSTATRTTEPDVTAGEKGSMRMKNMSEGLSLAEQVELAHIAHVSYEHWTLEFSSVYHVAQLAADGDDWATQITQMEDALGIPEKTRQQWSEE